jgi:hypothetical protein
LQSNLNNSNNANSTVDEAAYWDEEDEYAQEMNQEEGACSNGVVAQT